MKSQGSLNPNLMSYFACSPEHFCEYFCRTCLGIWHWKMAEILVNFLWSQFPRKQSTKDLGDKIRNKIRCKIRDKDSKNSVTLRSAPFLSLGDRDRGGSNLRKLEGGGCENFDFSGSRNLTLFYRVSIGNPQIGGQKSKLCKDNFRGEFPPPLAFGTSWPPLIPVSDNLM